MRDLKIEKPWGHEIIWARTEKYIGKILFIKKGHRLSLQYHRVKDETILVQSGTLSLTHPLPTGMPQDPQVGDSLLVVHTLRSGDSLHIKAGCIHRMAAIDDDVTVIEVSTPELEDVVRLEDDYNRAQVGLRIRSVQQ